MKDMSMKHRARRTIIAIIVLSVVVAQPSVAEPFSVGCPASLSAYEPMVANALRNAGLSPTFIYQDQAELVTNLALNRIQGGFFLSEAAVAAIPGGAIIPVALSSNDTVAVTMMPGIAIASREDLATRTVGILRGNSAYRLAAGDARITEFEGPEGLFKALATARVEIALAPRASVREYAASAGMRVWKIQEPPLASTPLYFVVSAQGRPFVPELMAAFKKAQDEGSWATGTEKIEKAESP